MAPERTPCPHCGRETQTASNGACVECWARKRDGPRLFPASRRERGYFWDELDDFLGAVFGAAYGGWLALGVLLLFLAVVFIVLA